MRVRTLIVALLLSAILAGCGGNCGASGSNRGQTVGCGLTTGF